MIFNSWVTNKKKLQTCAFWRGIHKLNSCNRRSSCEVFGLLYCKHIILLPRLLLLIKTIRISNDFFFSSSAYFSHEHMVLRATLQYLLYALFCLKKVIGHFPSGGRNTVERYLIQAHFQDPEAVPCIAVPRLTKRTAAYHIKFWKPSPSSLILGIRNQCNALCKESNTQ